MNINVTLFGQIITFTIFVAFTMYFVWPPIMKALNERQTKIADGLAAADRGHRELELAQHKSADILRDAKIKSGEIIEKANLRANQIIEESKAQARIEGDRLISLANTEIEQQKQLAKDELRQQIASLATLSAEKILSTKIDKAANEALINQFVNDMV